MIALRDALPVLRKGEQTELAATGDLLTFMRTDGSVRVFCAFNMGGDPAEVTLPLGDWTAVEGVGATGPGQGGLTLNGWGYALLRAV